MKRALISHLFQLVIHVDNARHVCG